MYTLDVVGSFKIESPPDTYLYHIEPIADCIATISSDNCLRLLNPLSLHEAPLHTVPNVHSEVTSLKTLDEGNSTICTGGSDGKVNIFDFRTVAKVAELRTGQNAAVLSLAATSSTYAIAAGTELTNSQASVVTWDTRSLQAPRSEYVESHSDDVTELQYHPTIGSFLLSGSTDGLVNLFNTNIEEEEDAVHQTVNHGASVHHAGFLSDIDIFALSHDEKYSMYRMVTNLEESIEEPPPVDFGDLRKKLGCEYVTNVISRPGGGVAGIGSHSQERFELVQLRNSLGWSFARDSSVSLSGAHGSDIVRSFCFLEKNKMILTAGEDGQVRGFQAE